jgi:hypothetical protein
MNRKCGDCTLCCKLVPVPNLGKPAHTRCKHQSHKGCKVYSRLALISPPCHLWACQWLRNPDAGELHRPDRAHYVIDIMPDFVGIQDEATGKTTDMPAMQIWADPDHPNAWREDKALRRYIERAAEKDGVLAIIRLDTSHGIALIPPCFCNDGQWHEKETVLPTPGGWVNPMTAALNEGRRLREEREATLRGNDASARRGTRRTSPVQDRC